MNKKRGVLLASAVLLTNSCNPPEECRRLEEPGIYEVHACDVFLGPFGIDAVVKGVDKSGDVDVFYRDYNGRKLFDYFFSPSAAPVAHYRINVYHAGEYGTLVRTNNVRDLYDKCAGISKRHSSDPSVCSKVAPTEALPGEILEISSTGYYFGKTNNPEFPQMATCSAKSLENVVIHTSAFLDLPPLEPGVSSLNIFMKNPHLTGRSHGSLAIWYFDKQDQENIDYNVEYCNTALEKERFSKGDHEITHLFLRGMSIPGMFNEGLANFVPTMLNDVVRPWNSSDSQCKEEGLQVGFEIKPYMKYDQAESQNFLYYYSGECFWVKLVDDYGAEIIPSVMETMDKYRWDKSVSFETALLIAGVDIQRYRQWGF